MFRACISYEVVLKFCSSKDFERSKSLDVSALADLKHLNRLQIVECYELEELKMDYTGVVQNRSQPFCFPQPQEDSNRRL